MHSTFSCRECCIWHSGFTGVLKWWPFFSLTAFPSSVWEHLQPCAPLCQLPAPVGAMLTLPKSSPTGYSITQHWLAFVVALTAGARDKYMWYRSMWCRLGFAEPQSKAEPFCSCSALACASLCCFQASPEQPASNAFTFTLGQFLGPLQIWGTLWLCWLLFQCHSPNQWL